LYKIIFFFVFDFIFGTFLLVFLSKYFSLRTGVSIFSLLLLSLLEKKEKKKIDLKQSKLTEIYDNADEFEILFNYSIYLQKSIVFKKFT